MVISVISATGVGHTRLSAFDNALKNAGVYNYNLIILSSVIPLGAKVEKKGNYQSNPAECGFRLYVVKAEIRQRDQTHSHFIGAGLGWYMLKTGGGVFVEHELEGHNKKDTEDVLKDKIFASLSDLCTFRGEKFSKDKAGFSIAVSPPSTLPHCALTLAVYKAEPW